MKSHALPLFGAAGLGFALAAVCFSAWTPRPASDQRPGAPTGFPNGVPLGGFNANTAAAAGPAQPISVQSLGTDQFVVATREPRLVQQIGKEGTAQNMLCTVVTHYTVRGERLVPIEHVRVPTGYLLITLE